MIADYFRESVTISRSTVTGNKTTYAVGATIAAHIQPMTDAFAPAPMGRTAKTFRMFSQAEVLIGDRLVDQDGNKYEVYGAEKHKFRGKQHYQSSLRGV